MVFVKCISKCLLMAWVSEGIERVSDIHHTTVINWVKQSGKNLPEVYNPEEIPEVGERDELQTFVSSKTNKISIWTVVNHFQPGILAWVVEDHGAKIFEPLWNIVQSLEVLLLCRRWI